MSPDLKLYPAYQSCRLPWLERLPNGWRTLRGKNVFKVVDVRSETGEEEILTVSVSDGVVPRSQRKVTMFKAESYVGHKLCWPGDLVINSLWAWMQGLGFSKHHGLASSAYGVYRLKSPFRSQWRFFDYLVRSAAYKWELQTRSKGVWLSRLQLSDSAFLDMPIIVPPADDAAAIVCFLDYIDRRTRRYIRAKRKLIALLEERKQAIIQRTVTRGLDRDVRLKLSGVEWLGEIPEHWETVPLKCLSSIQSGITLGKNYLNQETIEYPYLRVANVQDGHLALSEVKTVSVPTAEAERSTLQKGDVLMTEGGDPDKLGRGCVWDDQIAPCLHQNHIFAVRTRHDRLQPRFLAALLTSQYAKTYFLRSAKQTTNLASTNKTTIGRFPVLLPSLEEQAELLVYLQARTDRLDQSIANLRRQIDLIREYRTRLIADVVTGKLDVRQVAAHLPDEAEESEEWDEVEELDEDETMVDDDQEEEV